VLAFPLLIGIFTAASLGQLAGGFREVAVTDPDVMAAAKYAVEARSKKEKLALAQILKAEVQVVAGRNYRILMEVQVDGGIRQALAVVWAKLDGTCEMTKWEWKGEARPQGSDGDKR